MFWCQSVLLTYVCLQGRYDRPIVSLSSVAMLHSTASGINFCSKLVELRILAIINRLMIKNNSIKILIDKNFAQNLE